MGLTRSEGEVHAGIAWSIRVVRLIRCILDPPINHRARIHHANHGRNPRRRGVTAALGAMRNSRHSDVSGTEPFPGNLQERHSDVGADLVYRDGSTLISLSASASRAAALGEWSRRT